MKNCHSVLAIFLASVLFIGAAAEQYAVKRADILTKNHTTCNVDQAAELSFLSCPKTFEIYQTKEIADNPYETSLYGEPSAVVSAHTTLETIDSNRITWLVNKTLIYTAAEDDQSGVQKILLMKLLLNTTQVVDNLWVFDSFVVVRLSNLDILFYEKPLIEGFTVLPMFNIQSNFTVNPKFQTFEFARNEQNATQVYLYGVNNQIIYRYTFDVNLDNQTVTISNQTQTQVSDLSGLQFQSIVTSQYFIVSCSDCSSPGVYLFNHELVSVRNFSMPAQLNDTINLAIYQESKYMMQLFVAGRSSIDVIVMQQDTKGNDYFKQIKDIFVMDNPPNITIPHYIYIGKGRNYLVFKLSSQPYLYLMSLCMYNEFFNPKEFICEKCRDAHHSNGLQATQCYPCNTLWMMSKNDNVQFAIYQQNCTDGQFKSIIVVCGSIVIILIVGIICCCQNRIIEKRMRNLRDEEMKFEVSQIEKQVHQKVAEALGKVMGMKVGDQNWIKKMEAKKERTKKKPKDAIKEQTQPEDPQNHYVEDNRQTAQFATDHAMIDDTEAQRGQNLKKNGSAIIEMSDRGSFMNEEPQLNKSQRSQKSQKSNTRVGAFKKQNTSALQGRSRDYAIDDSNDNDGEISDSRSEKHVQVQASTAQKK